MQILKEDLTTFVTKENTEKLSSNIRPVGKQKRIHFDSSSSKWIRFLQMY